MIEKLGIVLWIGLVVGAIFFWGASYGDDRAMARVHERLAARCEMPAQYSQELLACVEVQP